MSYARRPRALLAALAFASLILGSTAAAPAKHAAKPAARAAAKTAPKPSAYHPHYSQAPADEYFGHLKMSILGVRNKVKDLGLDADLHPEHDRAVLGNALWVEDAMRDWAKKYPFDHWLPRYAFALESIYEGIPGDDAHKRAVRQLSYITAYFPQTVYGRVGRTKLALGVPTPEPHASDTPLSDLQRLALIDGKVQPTMPPAPMPETPAPSATPSPSPSAAPSAAPSPVPQGSAKPASR